MTAFKSFDNGFLKSSEEWAFESVVRSRELLTKMKKRHFVGIWHRPKWATKTCNSKFTILIYSRNGDKRMWNYWNLYYKNTTEQLQMKVYISLPFLYHAAGR